MLDPYEIVIQLHAFEAMVWGLLGVALFWGSRKLQGSMKSIPWVAGITCLLLGLESYLACLEGTIRPCPGQLPGAVFLLACLACYYFRTPAPRLVWLDPLIAAVLLPASLMSWRIRSHPVGVTEWELKGWLLFAAMFGSGLGFSLSGLRVKRILPRILAWILMIIFLFATLALIFSSP